MINEAEIKAAGRAERESRRESAPAIYWYLESATEFLIYAILIFTPWAFGTTENWAISSANTLNYILGGLLIGKWLICATTGYRPARWTNAATGEGALSQWITRSMVGMTVLILGYIALSAWNARAEFLIPDMRFEYIETSRDWLPRSYDKSSTWKVFQNYLATACFFWALRDWLRTKTWREAKRREERELAEPTSRTSLRGEKRNHSHNSHFPERLKRLLWLLCINGAVLALVGTLQRLSGSGELLWLVRPQMNEVATAQFGPFNYRSNGAQYLNMIWPVSLGFWWALHRQRQVGSPGTELEFAL